MDLLWICVSLSNQEALKNKGDEAWEMERRASLVNNKNKEKTRSCHVTKMHMKFDVLF
jgi:hypothetical protein